MVVDLPVAQAYLKRIPGLKISSEPMSEEQYGIGVRKGNAPLLKQINDGLAKIRENGEYDAITAKWFQDGRPALGLPRRRMHTDFARPMRPARAPGHRRTGGA